MKIPLLRRIIVGCVLCVTATAADYHVDGPGGGWSAFRVGRPLSAELMLEHVLSRQDGRGRILSVVFRFSDPTPLPLADCASRLKLAFAPLAGPDTFAHDSHHFGRSGHELRFPLERDGKHYSCELFVYPDGPVIRGIACATEITEGQTEGLVLDHLRRDSPPPPGVVRLAPLRVGDDAISSFPVSFRIVGRHDTHRVVKLIISEVPDPETSPLHVDDLILKIDGRPVEEFDFAMDKDSELGRIFLNRRPGETVTLELREATTGLTYSATLEVLLLSRWRPW